MRPHAPLSLNNACLGLTLCGPGVLSQQFWYSSSDYLSVLCCPRNVELYIVSLEGHGVIAV